MQVKNDCRWCKNLGRGGGHEEPEYYECNVSTKDCLSSFPFKNTSCKQFVRAENYVKPTTNEYLQRLLREHKITN